MINQIIVAISILLILALNIYMPIKRHKFLLQCGSCIYAFPKSNKLRSVFIVFLALVLLVLVLLMDYHFFINIVFCGCSLLAINIALKELYFSKIQGVYEKALLFSSELIEYSKIESYLLDDVGAIPNTIIFKMANKSPTIHFDSTEQMNVVLKKVKECIKAKK